MTAVLSVSKQQNRLSWGVQGWARWKVEELQLLGWGQEVRAVRCHPALSFSLSLVPGYKEASPMEL